LAKELAQHLFETVRLFGNGKWNRDAEGKWTLEEFVVESFDLLRNESLSEALQELHGLTSFMNAEAFNELEILRHGPPEKQNGSS
jgi:hypothetical protein